MTSMREVIKRTLESMSSYQHHNTSTVRLIEVTFLAQSNMQGYLNTTHNPHLYGMMALSEEQLKTFINTKIKTNPSWVRDINDVCLINLYIDSIDDVIEAASYNIAFQIMITMFIYLERTGDFPIGIDDIISHYFSYFLSPLPNTKGNISMVKDRVKQWNNNKGQMVA